MNYATKLRRGGRRKKKTRASQTKSRGIEKNSTSKRYFATADKGDAAAVERLKKYQAGYDEVWCS